MQKQPKIYCLHCRQSAKGREKGIKMMIKTTTTTKKCVCLMATIIMINDKVKVYTVHTLYTVYTVCMYTVQ